MSNEIINKNIFSEFGDLKMLSFSNAEGKKWIIPQKNLFMGLQLYQPSSFKGRLVKLFLPYLSTIPFCLFFFKAKQISLNLSDQIINTIKEIFNIDSFQFSVFEGTPSFNLKPTIQIFVENNILGYCKVSDRIHIFNLFKKESDTLKYLNDLGVKNIPNPMYCKKIDEKNYLFVQSTIKTKYSKTSNEWTNLHEDFLIDLNKKSLVKKSFESSDFNITLSRLKDDLNKIPINDQIVLQEAIQIVYKYFENTKEFCAFHGDFTPWNMFIEDNVLFVFDFEYSQLSFPLYLDFFHYSLQVAIIVKSLTDEQAYRFVVNNILSSNIKFHNYRVSFLAYLLFIIHTNISIEDDVNYPTRFYIINRIINDLKENIFDT